MSAVLAIIVVAAAAWGLLSVIRSARRVDVQQAQRLVTAGAVLLDVRDSNEFRANHLRKARNIPLAELKERCSQLGDRRKPVVVYCGSGGESARASSILRSAGFTKVHDFGPMSRWTLAR